MDRDKRKNRELVYANVSNFLTNNPNPGIEFDYGFYKNNDPRDYTSGIERRSEKYFTDENMVVTITGPRKKELPFRQRQISKGTGSF